MSTTETRKAQIALRKFQDVAQLHLDILKERKENIRKHRSSGDHRALSIEKSRADLVVKQLYDDVQQMFTWCSDLQPETWEWVQLQLRPLNARIQSALSDFMNECGNNGIAQNDSTATQNSSSISNGQFWQDEDAEAQKLIQEGVSDERSQKLLMLSETVEQRRMESEVHRQLLSDILELNEIMKEMNAVVRIQGETVDTIEENVDKALTNVQVGERSLFKAMKIKAAGYPIAGALIGAGAAAGPVGLLVGVKVAVVAAIGGSVAGAVSGHFLRKKVINDDLEMKRLPSTPSLDSKTSNRRKID